MLTINKSMLYNKVLTSSLLKISRPSLDRLVKMGRIRTYLKSGKVYVNADDIEKEIELNEGLYHVGKGSVVRFVGKKK